MSLVSIIIPMFNVAHFLEKCVNSVFNQGLESDRYEILMINDGSPDESEQVARGLAEHHSSITVISQENKGLGGARNTGIDNARGDYLVFLDADDILIENKLNVVLALAEKYKLDILEFGANQIDEDGKVIATISKTSREQIYNGITYYKKFKYMNSACNKLYNAEFLNHNKLRFTEKIYAEDFEFNTRTFYYARRILATNIIAASFLQSPESITRNKDKAKKNKYVEDNIQIIQKVKEFQNQVSNNNQDIEEYFNERLAVRNSGLFYFMFKHKYSYSEFKAVKQRLELKELFYNNISLDEVRRELFRKIFLKNFWLFRISQTLRF